MNKKKIGLFLGVKPTCGGMFQYAQSLSEALSSLDPKKYDVCVAYGDRRWEPIFSNFELTGHYLKRLELGSFISNFIMAFLFPVGLSRVLSRWINPIVRDLDRVGCDYWIFPGQEALSYQISSKTIGTIHDLMHRYEPNFPEVKSMGRYFIREHRFKNISKVCKAILVDSEVGKQHVVDSYKVDPTKIYSLPYVYPSYITTSKLRDDFEVHYDLPSKYLFYPAQFWAHKNHSNLLKAVAVAVRSCDDIRVVFSGNLSRGYTNIRKLVNALGLEGRIHFLGYVPDEDIRGLYERARALVMPTFFGPTNIPPLEAIAAGCPALVSNIYGMPEQLGDAGLYFDPRSVDDLAEAIIRIWGDDELCKQQSLLGFERAKLYNQHKFNQRFSDLIDKAVC